MTESDWQVVATYGAPWEAEIAQGRLQAARVPSRIDRRGSVGLFGPSHQGTSVRGVALLVPADRLQAARKALDLNDA